MGAPRLGGSNAICRARGAARPGTRRPDRDLQGRQWFVASLCIRPRLSIRDIRIRVYPDGRAAWPRSRKPRAQPVPAADSAGPLERRGLDGGQAACRACPRAGERGGARAYRSRCVRIFSITGRSRMAAMILNCPVPQIGQCCMSMSNTRLSSRAQLMRPGRAWAVSISHSAAAVDSVAGSPGVCGRVRAAALGRRDQDSGCLFRVGCAS